MGRVTVWYLVVVIARCSGSAGGIWRHNASSGLMTRERVPMLLKHVYFPLTHIATHHQLVSRNL